MKHEPFRIRVARKELGAPTAPSPIPIHTNPADGFLKRLALLLVDKLAVVVIAALVAHYFNSQIEALKNQFAAEQRIATESAAIQLERMRSELTRQQEAHSAQLKFSNSMRIQTLETKDRIARDVRERIAERRSAAYAELLTAYSAAFKPLPPKEVLEQARRTINAQTFALSVYAPAPVVKKMFELKQAASLGSPTMVSLLAELLALMRSTLGDPLDPISVQTIHGLMLDPRQTRAVESPP
jgi:hypothetical protein